jgi:3-oxoacyl-[acyl-carrier protein] reductase
MSTKEMVAVIVGGTGNIGKALTERLLQAGCGVAIVSRGKNNEDQLSNKSAAQTISGLTIHQADFTNEFQVRDCLMEIKSSRGRIDFLIYSAGIEPDMDVPLAEYSTDSWIATFNVYLTGFFFAFREGMKVIETGGHIVVLSSAVTRFPSNALPPLYIGHYAASKAALNELVKWARREAAQKDILLSRIAPSAVETPFHQDAPAYRRPAAVVPMSIVVEKIISALLMKKEFDGEIIAEPS